MSNQYFSKLSKTLKNRLSNPNFNKWTKNKPLPALIKIINTPDDKFPDKYINIKSDAQLLILKYTYWEMKRYGNKIPDKILKEMKNYKDLSNIRIELEKDKN